MNPAIATLIAVVVAIVISMFARLNVGLLALAFAWIVGTMFAGVSPNDIVAGFPSSLFVTLAGVTLLFAIAEVNGTLGQLAQGAVRAARGNARVVPLLLFGIALVLSSAGPGAISSVALLIPLSMSIGRRVGASPFLTSLMVANGANAGNLSPVASVGVIANSKMAEVGLGGNEGKVWLANFAAHAAVALVAYFMLGGHKLTMQAAAPGDVEENKSLTTTQRLSAALILLWIAGVVLLKLHLGLSAFTMAVVLLLLRCADESTAMRSVPWGVIMLVTGVSTLIALLERTGGMELFSALLSRLATPDSVNGMIAFLTGIISMYSSTAGVVLPTFLPTVNGLVTNLGGGDPLAIALSINVGASVVDVSPLSTLGALCVAAVADPESSRRLFQRLLAWGLAMSVAGAAMSQLFAGVLARW